MLGINGGGKFPSVREGLGTYRTRGVFACVDGLAVEGVTNWTLMAEGLLLFLR
jgi:hypothetical protein